MRSATCFLVLLIFVSSRIHMFDFQELEYAEPLLRQKEQQHLFERSTWPALAKPDFRPPRSAELKVQWPRASNAREKPKMLG